MIWNRYQYWVTELSKTTNYGEKRGKRTKPRRKTTINVELMDKLMENEEVSSKSYHSIN